MALIIMTSITIMIQTSIPNGFTNAKKLGLTVGRGLANVSWPLS